MKIKRRKREPFGKTKLILTFVFVLIAVSGIYYFYSSEKKTEISFNVDHVFLKTVIKEGEVSSSPFRIENLGASGNFYIEISGISDKILISESNFDILSGESKEIKTYFNDTSFPSGIYVGSLIIGNNIDSITLPVILEVQSKKPVFAINTEVTPSYKEIQQGTETFSQINFFNLKDRLTHTGKLKYRIINLNGETIVSENQEILLGSQSSISKNTLVPIDTSIGEHVYAIILESENTTSTSTYLFSVVSEKKNALPFGLDLNSFFSFVVIVILFFIFVMIIFLLYERSRLFNELKAQQESELKFSSEIIDKGKNDSLQKVRSDGEREKILKEFQEAKEKILKELKEIQKHHRKEFTELNKKEENKDVLEKKIKQWKKDTYQKAVKKANISDKLKQKLVTLKKAYEQGYISKDAFEKGKSRIKSADKG